MQEKFSEQFWKHCKNIEQIQMLISTQRTCATKSDSFWVRCLDKNRF